MRSHHQAAVWIDHHEARVFHVRAGDIDVSPIGAPHRHVQRHPKDTRAERQHPEDERRFFHDVAEALADADQILVLGPSTAKLQLLRYLREHAPLVEQRVVAVETVDHPTDRQLVAQVKAYFDPRAAETR